MLACAREFFSTRSVLEVQTPALSNAAVSDVHIESLETTVNAAPRFLRTSPEYPMKRLLASGFPDIYEIGQVFRDGEIGKRHQPEFCMVEWYRHGYTLQSLIDETVLFIREQIDRPGSHLYRKIRAVKQHQFDDVLLATTQVTSESTIDDLQRVAGDQASDTFSDDRDALLGYLFDTFVAAKFAPDKLTVVTHYPATQAALAQLCPDTHRALRFEVFCGSLELANGFLELQDVDEQRGRFDQDQDRRYDNQQSVRPIDQNFLDALSAGLPDCSGVAVGFDRLVMLASGEQDIRSVVTFAHE